MDNDIVTIMLWIVLYFFSPSFILLCFFFFFFCWIQCMCYGGGVARYFTEECTSVVVKKWL